MSKRRRRSDGEGSLTPYESASGTRWRISWREYKDPDRPELGRRQRTRRGFETEREARLELRDMVSKAELGQRTTQSADTFKPYALKWLKSKRVARNTWNAYHRLLTLHVIPRIGEMPIGKIRPSDLSAMYRDIETTPSTRRGWGGKPVGPNTVHKIHQLISQIFEAAIEDEIIVTNPAARKAANPPSGREIKNAKPDMVVWTQQQLADFTEWLQDQDDIAGNLIQLLAATGMRRGEVLSLKFGDDVVEGSIRVSRATTRSHLRGERTVVTEGPTKNARDRTIDLGESAKQALRSQKVMLSSINLAFIRRGRYVFVGEDGEQLDAERALRRFKALQRRYNAEHAGNELPPLTLQGLRHTHATHFLAAGNDARVAQDRLGHASPGFTLSHYAQVLPGIQKEGTKKYEEMMASFRRDAPKGS